MTTEGIIRSCWCGNTDLSPFKSEYSLCGECMTLVSQRSLPIEPVGVIDDDRDFYGKHYWTDRQARDLGLPDLNTRARNDLTERNLHWLKTLLEFRLPPGKVVELGCAHGSFVALLREAGYDASGVEMSPWVVEFGRKTFGVPIYVGPVEALEISSGCLDVIALMDVLEHLPNPAATMAHCLELLKPDGLLLIQTPQFKGDMNYGEMVEAKSPFLELLKDWGHLFLFSDRAVKLLFERMGADHIRFETAIFSHYDMFFAVSRMPFVVHSTEVIEAALTAKPQGRLALALLDIYSRESSALAQLKADKAHLVAQLQASEADRAARLEVIERQGEQIERQGEQIERQGEQIQRQGEQIERQGEKLAGLYENIWVRIGLKLGFISTKRL